MDSRREAIVTMIRMRSDHHSLKYSRFRKNMCDDPVCECGEDVEDLNHVFWICDKYSNQRKFLYRPGG